MTTQKDFTALVRERFDPLMKEHGYVRKRGTSYELESNQVVRFVLFLRSRDGKGFVPRLSIAARPFEELGAIVSKDLPALLPNPDPNKNWWRWYAREEAVAEILAGLESFGLPWLERLGHLPHLIEHLEANKYFATNPSEDLRKGIASLEEMGIRTLHAQALSGGAERPAPQLRPDVVERLSYCYELGRQWAKAFKAWQEYCTIFPPGDRSDFLKAVGKRLDYLRERAEKAAVVS